MYWLMTYAGSVGKPMKNSELDKLMKTAFSGFDKMLFGKKLPMNIRALQDVVIELLRTLIGQETTQNNMTTILQDFSNNIQIAERWTKKFSLSCAPYDDVCPCRV